MIKDQKTFTCEQINENNFLCIQILLQKIIVCTQSLNSIRVLTHFSLLLSVRCGLIIALDLNESAACSDTKYMTSGGFIFAYQLS